MGNPSKKLRGAPKDLLEVLSRMSERQIQKSLEGLKKERGATPGGEKLRLDMIRWTEGYLEWLDDRGDLVVIDRDGIQKTQRQMYQERARADFQAGSAALRGNFASAFVYWLTGDANLAGIAGGLFEAVGTGVTDRNTNQQIQPDAPRPIPKTLHVPPEPSAEPPGPEARGKLDPNVEGDRAVLLGLQEAFLPTPLGEIASSVAALADVSGGSDVFAALLFLTGDEDVAQLVDTVADTVGEEGDDEVGDDEPAPEDVAPDDGRTTADLDTPDFDEGGALAGDLAGGEGAAGDADGLVAQDPAGEGEQAPDDALLDPAGGAGGDLLAGADPPERTTAHDAPAYAASGNDAGDTGSDEGGGDDPGLVDDYDAGHVAVAEEEPEQDGAGRDAEPDTEGLVDDVPGGDGMPLLDEGEPIRLAEAEDEQLPEQDDQPVAGPEVV